MKTIHYKKSPNGFDIWHGDQPLLTPLQKPITLPNEKLACFISEHNPILKHIMTIFDLVNNDRANYEQRILDAINHDTCFYWAEQPKDLVSKQHQIWGHLLKQISQKSNVILQKTHGLKPITQPNTLIQSYKNWIDSLNNFQLFATHEIVFELKSPLIAHALLKDELSFDKAFEAAFLEELHQIELWGITEEQEERHKEIKSECHLLLQLYELSA